jgi:hypothetical protein
MRTRPRIEIVSWMAEAIEAIIVNVLVCFLHSVNLDQKIKLKRWWDCEKAN